MSERWTTVSTDRHAANRNYTQTEKQADRQTPRHRQPDRQAGRQAVETDRQTDRQTGRLAGGNFRRQADSPASVTLF